MRQLIGDAEATGDTVIKVVMKIIGASLVEGDGKTLSQRQVSLIYTSNIAHLNYGADAPKLKRFDKYKKSYLVRYNYLLHMLLDKLPLQGYPDHIDPLGSNNQEVANWFATHGPSVRLQRFALSLFKLVAKPKVVFEPATDDYPGAEVLVAENLDSDDPSLVAMTHHSWLDIVNDGAAVKRTRALNEIAGNVIVPAKLSLLNGSRFIGYVLAKLGAKLVIREKDVINHLMKQDPSLTADEAEKQVKKISAERAKSNSKFRQASIESVNAGWTEASYEESERNTVNHHEVQPIKKGKKVTLSQIDHPERAKIIILSHDYGHPSKLKRFLTPTIYVQIIDAPAPDDVTDILQAKMQEGVEKAITHRPEAYLSPLAKATITAAAVGSLAIARKLVSKR